MTKYLISIVGPTAIGKTALGIQLAQHYDTEIISADSRQFYSEMSIGTAVPSESELASAKHHFIHFKSILDEYNVGEFERDAITLIDELFKTRDVIIMVGGSGLYVDAVINGLDDFPKVDPSIRVKLNEQLKNDGLQKLQEQLKLLDLKAYNTIAIDNPHRVIRALEISIGTQVAFSTFLKRTKKIRNFETISIGLTAERPIIYERINERVDLMMSEGLLDEAQKLSSKQHLNALNTVGYKELFNYIKGDYTLEFAVAEIKKNSRRFAKRQMTWFKKNTSIQWFKFNTNLNPIIQHIDNKMVK